MRGRSRRTWPQPATPPRPFDLVVTGALADEQRVRLVAVSPDQSVGVEEAPWAPAGGRPFVCAFWPQARRVACLPTLEHWRAFLSLASSTDGGFAPPAESSSSEAVPTDEDDFVPDTRWQQCPHHCFHHRA